MGASPAVQQARLARIEEARKMVEPLAKEDFELYYDPADNHVCMRVETSKESDRVRALLPPGSFIHVHSRKELEEIWKQED